MGTSQIEVGTSNIEVVTTIHIIQNAKGGGVVSSFSFMRSPSIILCFEKSMGASLKCGALFSTTHKN